MLILTPIENALLTLKEALDLHAACAEPILKKALRDSVIQRFEYSFELTHKFIKRQLAVISKSADELNSLPYRDLIREAGRVGLVDNVEGFFAYRDARNLTSHTYDEEKAERVFAVIPQFYQDAMQVLHQIKKHNGS
jgi:nucleotidyltransferase substrate binding protein (TIGR01987 family)